MHRPYEKRYLVGSFDPSYALRFIFQGKGTGAVTGGAGGASLGVALATLGSMNISGRPDQALQWYALWSASDSRAGMLVLLDDPVQKKKTDHRSLLLQTLPVCFSLAP
jgi:hypothetical protein